MGRWIGRTSLLCLLVAAVSFWFRHDFPAPQARHLPPELLEEPQQQATNDTPFTVQRAGFTYTVTPRYHYRLVGMVVSYSGHDASYGLHRNWGDHLNIADLCVVWGDNAAAVDLNKINFWNGEFTCNFETKDQATWESFHLDQASNNHILVDDTRLRDKISDVKIGDIISIDGWLSEYANDQGFHRGTSTRRDDTGNGACETIFVRDYQVLGNSHTTWATTFRTALWLFIISATLWLAGVVTGRF